jgi:hypothetical protein
MMWRPQHRVKKQLIDTKERSTSMLKLAVRYARYALSTLASLGFIALTGGN